MLLYPSWQGGEYLQLYRWRARNKSGKIFTGRLLASSDREVAEYVQGQHGYVTQIQPINNWYNLSKTLYAKKINNKNKESFFRQLATLLNSGMTLLRALELIRGKSTGDVAEVCAFIEKDLYKGMSFSMSMRKLPNIFSQTAVQIIEAGETSGKLAELFLQLADFYHKELETKRFLANACIYPWIVLVFVFITFYYFIWKVVPLFLELYAAMQVEPTVFLSGLTFLGKLLDNFHWQAVGIFLLLGWRLYFWRDKLQIWGLRLPVIKSCYHDLLEIRYCRVISIMLASGISLPLAITAAGETLPIILLRQQSERLSREVLRGIPFSKAAAFCSEIFGTTSLEFIAVGEESGSLTEMLIEAADITEKDLQAKLKDLKAIVEPALLAIIALLVGCVILAITSPIFSLITQLPDYK
jgi:Type II secretory pathway, component PulF